MGTMTYTDRLTIIDCGVCHIPFAIPENLYSKLVKTGEWFWCPNGHHIHYFETDNDRLKREVETAERRLAARQAQLDQARAEAEHQAAVARGFKGAMVKAKKRAAKGVCPVPGCHRHFADVQRHMASKHPDWTAEG